MSPTTRSQNKDKESSNNNTMNTSETSTTGHSGQTANQSLEAAASQDNTTVSQGETTLPNPSFSPNADSTVSVHKNSLTHLFGAMSEAHGEERAAEEYAKIIPVAVIRKLVAAATAANNDNEISQNMQNLSLNTSNHSEVTNNTENQNENGSQHDQDTQHNLVSSTPNPNGSENSDSTNSNEQQNDTEASIVSNSTHDNSFNYTKEELAQLLVQAARRQDTGDVFNNTSLQRIPELYAYGTSPNGTKTARPSLVFQKIEEIYPQESQRKDALRLRVRGLASNYLYEILASSPNSTYEEQKQALLRRFKVKLTKTEYMARFQNLRKADRETLSNYAERICRLANSFRESNLDNVSEDLIDNLSCAALFPYIPFWLLTEIRLDQLHVSDMKFPELWETLRDKLERAYATRAQFKGRNPLKSSLEEQEQDLENLYSNDMEQPEIASANITGQLNENQSSKNPNDTKKVRFATNNNTGNKSPNFSLNRPGSYPATGNSKTCGVTKCQACNYHCFRRQGNQYNYNQYRSNQIHPFYSRGNQYQFPNSVNNNRFNSRFPHRNFETAPNREGRQSQNRDFQRFPNRNQGDRNQGFRNPGFQRTPNMRNGTNNGLNQNHRQMQTATKTTPNTSTANANTQTNTRNLSAEQIAAFEWEDDNILSFENF